MQPFWSMSQEVAVFVYGAPLDQCLGLSGIVCGGSYAIHRACQESCVEGHTLAR